MKNENKQTFLDANSAERAFYIIELLSHHHEIDGYGWYKKTVDRYTKLSYTTAKSWYSVEYKGGNLIPNDNISLKPKNTDKINQALELTTQKEIKNKIWKYPFTKEDFKEFILNLDYFNEHSIKKRESLINLIGKWRVYYFSNESNINQNLHILDQRSYCIELEIFPDYSCTIYHTYVYSNEYKYDIKCDVFYTNDIAIKLKEAGQYLRYKECLNISNKILIDNISSKEVIVIQSKEKELDHSEYKGGYYAIPLIKKESLYSYKVNYEEKGCYTHKNKLMVNIDKNTHGNHLYHSIIDFFDSKTLTKHEKRIITLQLIFLLDEKYDNSNYINSISHYNIKMKDLKIAGSLKKFIKTFDNLKVILDKLFIDENFQKIVLTTFEMKDFAYAFYLKSIYEGELEL